MFKKKFDYMFIENKMMNYFLEKTKETIAVLNTEDGIIQGVEAATISKTLSKKIKSDLTKGIKKGVKFAIKERKKYIKAGIIDAEEEKLDFLREVGAFTLIESDEDEQVEEPAETSSEIVSSEEKKNLQTEKETTVNAQNKAKKDEPTETEENPDKPKKTRKKKAENAGASETAGENKKNSSTQGGESLLPARETQAGERTAKIEKNK